jgi:hypothetical protein
MVCSISRESLLKRFMLVFVLALSGCDFKEEAKTQCHQTQADNNRHIACAKRWRAKCLDGAFDQHDDPRKVCKGHKGVRFWIKPPDG